MISADLDPRSAAAALRALAERLEDPMSTAADVARTAGAARDLAEVTQVTALGRVEEERAYELDGASGIVTWARRELRLDPRTVTTARRAREVLDDLPLVRASAAAGELRLDHLRAFAFGLAQVGAEVVRAHEADLVEVARTHEPSALLRLIRRLRAAVRPDELDAAWLAGMEREDVRLLPCGDGFQVTGFLGMDAGAGLRTVLESWSTPRAEGDERTTAQRRVDGLRELVAAVLASGRLPADGGVRPHLTVTLSVDALERARAGVGVSAGVATGTVAHLEGFGPIGPALAGYLACVGDLTPVVTASEGAGVLDVGRTRRLATARQRRAVSTHQRGRCAAPGCALPVNEVHHVTWWRHGGRTDLANLVGLCGPCHRLVHAGRLVLEIDGLPPADRHEREPGVRRHVAPDRRIRFRTTTGRPVERRRVSRTVPGPRHRPETADTSGARGP